VGVANMDSVDQMPLFAREEIRVFWRGEGARESELYTNMHHYILAKLIP